VVVDAKARLLFYTDNGRNTINVARTDHSHDHRIIITYAKHPRTIQIDSMRRSALCTAPYPQPGYISVRKIIVVIIMVALVNPGSELGGGAAIFRHVLLYSQGSQDKCPNHVRIKQKSHTFFVCHSYAIVLPEVFCEIKNDQIYCRRGFSSDHDWGSFNFLVSDSFSADVIRVQTHLLD